jgi:hypothetical protein
MLAAIGRLLNNLVAEGSTSGARMRIFPVRQNRLHGAKNVKCGEGNRAVHTFKKIYLSLPADSSRPWTAREKDLLATGSHMFGSDYCKLARLIVTRSCIEVARVVQASSTEGGSGCTAENNYTEFQKAASKKKRSAGRQVLSRQVRLMPSFAGAVWR